MAGGALKRGAPRTIPTRRGLRVSLRLAWVLAIGLTPILAACSTGPPNVVLISLDTVRADHLSLYGYNRQTTPNLERFAEEGVLFEHASTPVPWTVPAHMSVFTALYPTVHGVTHLTPRTATVKHLTEYLEDRGYATGAVVGPVLASYGFGKGFDHYFAPTRDRPAELQVRHALRWLAGDPRHPELPDRPFFLFLHLFDAHHTYDPPWPFDTAFVDSYRPDIHEINGSHPYKQDKHLSAEELRETIALYDGEIAYVDHVLGGFFETLRSLGVYERSLIVVMADHGEGFLEHGLMNHGNSVYEELLHVPLLVRFPGGSFAGRHVETPARLVDVAPTVLDVVGVPPMPDAQGVSLLPQIRGEEAGRRLVQAWGAFASGVRLGDWKLIANPPERFETIPRALAADYELYDLARDPGEANNLAEAVPERREAMLRELKRLEEENRALRQRLLSALDSRPLDLDEDQLRRLRALGYIE